MRDGDCPSDGSLQFAVIGQDLNGVIALLTQNERIVSPLQASPRFQMFFTKWGGASQMKKQAWLPRPPSLTFCLNEWFKNLGLNSAHEPVHPRGPPIAIQHDGFTPLQAGHYHSLDSIEVSCNMKGLQTCRSETLNLNAARIVVEPINEVTQCAY